MNFTTFLVSSTNIFPLANSVAGGQLLSEWNLRSREMVSTWSKINFDAGHSFTHSDNDFKVALDNGDIDNAVSNTVLKIFPGRAIINGHFVENLAPMYVDILEANTELQTQHMTPLTGKLAIGIRVYYSESSTMAGAMVPEDEDSKYLGVQLVVLPEDMLKTPMDSPNNEGAVTCHLKLATFTYRNGAIIGSTISQNPDKTKYIDGERVFNMNELLSDTYISRAGISPNRLYVFAGKSTYNSSTGSYEVSGKDTWCDATSSLMVWDSNVDINTNTTTDKNEIGNEAVFGVDFADDSIFLDIPHKQVDGMKNTDGDLLYYKDKVLKLPKADYALNTPGTITSTYTKNIKNINARIDKELHQLAKGKQKAYRETLSSQEVDSNDITKLPKIESNWDVGDYVLVGQDYTVENATTADAPSTIYAVIPGLVRELAYIGYTTGEGDSTKEYWESGYSMPTGIELYEASISEDLFTIAEVSNEKFQKRYMSNTPIAFQNADDDISVDVTQYTNNTVTFLGDGVTKTFESTMLQKPSGITWDSIPEGNMVPINTGGNIDIIRVRVGNTIISADPGTPVSVNTQYYQFNQNTGKITIVQYHNISDTSPTIVILDDGVMLRVDAKRTYTRKLPAALVNSVTGEILAEHVVADLEDTSMEVAYSYYAMNQELSDMFPEYTTLRGIPMSSNGVPVDYFTVTYAPDGQLAKKYYFAVTSATAKEWSSTIYLTGTIPLAGEDTIGGFKNISSDMLDAGYVYMDDDGHLRLVDYGLLRTGLLAYQLGEDLTFPTSLSLSEIQENLDEYVNDRIAFPNSTQKENAAKNNVPANVIHITIDLADAESSDLAEDEEDISTTGETANTTGASNRVITIRNIDSRFGTCVYFHFTGTATSNTTINIIDCQKIRIDPTICGNTTSNTYEGGPIINLYRTNLYYDASVLNYIVSADRNTLANGTNEEIIYEDGVVYTDYYPETFTGIIGLSLWYQPYEATDPQIVVDDKTVSELDVGYISESFEFWDIGAPNDTHFKTALSSISFDGTGVITKVGLLIADSSTNNIDPDGQHVFYGEFTLPQGISLSYPQACIKKPLKITGNFISAYKPVNGTDVIISDINFTAETGVYDVVNSNRNATGNIAILADITSIPFNADFDTNLAPWKQDTYNLFYGGTVC